MKSLFVRLTLVILVAGISLAGAAPSDGSHSGRMSVLESYNAEAQGDIQKAIDKMVPIFQSNPKDYFANFRLGWLFYLKKNYKNAITHYSSAAEIKSSSVEALLGLTLVHLATANYTQVIAVAGQVLERDSRNYFGIQRKITAELRLKKFQEALGDASRALEFYPSDLVFLEQKGFSQMSLGQSNEAKETLGYLLMLSPKNAYALSVLGGK